jgi:hypothetical protein
MNAIEILKDTSILDEEASGYNIIVEDLMGSTLFEKLYESAVEEFGFDNYLADDSYRLGLRHATLFFANILAAKELEERHHEKETERDPDAWKDGWIVPYWEANRGRYMNMILEGQPPLFEAIPTTKEAAASCEEIAATIEAKTGKPLGAEQVRKRCIALRELGLVRLEWREREGRGGNVWTFWRPPFPTGFDKVAIEALSKAQEDYILNC